MIILTIYISDPTAVIAAGYNAVKVYRSDYESGYFTEITNVSTRPAISVSSKYINYEDNSYYGVSSSWYKTSYYNTVSAAESSLSTATHGIAVEQTSLVATYPAEKSLTSTDRFNVDRIRYYVGDEKKTYRDYVSPTCLAGYENVSTDGTTYKVDNPKGWPLKVIKDSIEYSTSSNPAVVDYSFLTFSGTTISTVSGVLDVWYESFRHSDREILDIYTTTPEPPYMTSATTTSDMYHISAAITILEMELRQLMGETSGSFSLQGELSYNPEPLLRQKREDLAELKSKLKELTNEMSSLIITGVRID
jgi:hypothetical protein